MLQSSAVGLPCCRRDRAANRGDAHRRQEVQGPPAAVFTDLQGLLPRRPAHPPVPARQPRQHDSGLSQQRSDRQLHRQPHQQGLCIWNLPAGLRAPSRGSESRPRDLTSEAFHKLLPLSKHTPGRRACLPTPEPYLWLKKANTVQLQEDAISGCL